MATPGGMRIGVALPQCDWPGDTPWPLERIIAYGVRAEALGFHSLWTNDHAFLEDTGSRRLLGGEPLTLLSFLAGRTSTAQLGTLVTCARFRSPGQLAREAMTLAELSGGRFILGLGAGWHEPELRALHIPTDHAHSRFVEYVEALRALLTGEPVDYDGHYVRLTGAQIAGTVAPPLWLAASGPRALALAATVADGWNGAGPEPDRLLMALRSAEAEAGRPPGSVVASASVTALLAAPAEAERMLALHPPPFGRPVIGVDGLRAAVESSRRAGYGHLILHLSGFIWSSSGEDHLKLAAEALGLSG
jgi:alkanesulfonate monooxygenase SsuD/methylene tetrahydromethanopterin reductase-like flavin-dependent oxidoreductase (luciferase family)